jgi:putative peptide zinc metalloprotease protein
MEEFKADPNGTADGVPVSQNEDVNEALPDLPGSKINTGEPVLLSLRRTVTASSREIGGKRILVLHNEETGKFYHLGAEESVVVSLLDGSIPLSNVAASIKSLCIEWSDEELKAFLSMLVKAGLISVVGASGNEQVAAPAEPPPARPAVQRVGMLLGSVLSQRFPLGNADALASALLPYLGFAYSRVGFGVWVFSITIACAIAMDHSSAITAQCRLMFQPESWISIACIGILIKVVHELGHAIAAKRKGVRVGSVGITLFLLAPLAYIDLTNSWKLRPRWARIQIALGGVYLESWLAIIATILFAWSKDDFTQHLLAQVMLIAGPATWITNANPLMRLDGYYALSDGLDIPNLRMHGRSRCLAIFDHWLLSVPMQESHLTGWRRRFAVVHALGSILFSAFWMTGIIVAVWHWASSVGVVLACVALIAWIVIPTTAWWMRHWSASAGNPVIGPRVRRRMVAIATLLIMAVPTVLSARNPFAQGVPVVVQYRNEQVARAAADGFVSSVFVRGNQYVHRGDLLMEVTDEQLLLRRNQMSDDLEVSLAKYRQLQNSGKLAEAEAAFETAKQLRVSIAELNESLAALCVVATRDGVVVSDQPEKWLGKFAKRGDILIRVADPDDKELLVAIAESEYSAYHEAVKQGRPLVARIRGGRRLKVEPMMANPRFSTTLPHPALAAPAGGDIAVTPDAKAESGYRSAVPIGAAIAWLTPKESLLVRAGQRGTLYLADDQITFARLKQAFTNAK